MLKQLTRKQALNMLKFYSDSELRIKQKLRDSLKAGRDTTYLNNLLDSVQKDIKDLDDYFKYFSQQELKLLYKYSSDQVEKVIEKAQKEKQINIQRTSFGKANQNSIKILSENTYNALQNVTNAIGRTTNDFIREAGLRKAGGIVQGTESVSQTAKNLLLELENNNFFNIRYANGMKMPTKAYSMMVARTTSAEAFRAGTMDRIQNYDMDLVDVIGISSFPKSPCIPFQGKTLSLSGKTEGYIPLAQAKAAGLFHPNCIHDLGLSEKNFDYL